MYKHIEVNEIDSKYVGSDCAQVMITFVKSLSVFNENGLVCYGRGYGENKVDNTQYIEDKRKEQFPFNEIPYHTTEGLYFNSICINQLFDFNKPYILIRDGELSQCLIVNNNDKSYLIETSYDTENNYSQVKNCVDKSDMYNFFKELVSFDDKKTYIIDSTGKHFNKCFVRSNIKEKINYDFKDQKLFYGYSKFFKFIIEDEFMLPFFMIKLKENDIQIKHIQLLNNDNGIINIMDKDITLEKYDIQQIREILKESNKKLGEPVISKKNERAVFSCDRGLVIDPKKMKLKIKRKYCEMENLIVNKEELKFK